MALQVMEIILGVTFVLGGSAGNATTDHPQHIGHHLAKSSIGSPPAPQHMLEVEVLPYPDLTGVAALSTDEHTPGLRMRDLLIK